MSFKQGIKSDETGCIPVFFQDFFEHFGIFGFEILGIDAGSKRIDGVGGITTLYKVPLKQNSVFS